MPSDDPVTIIITRTVRPGSEAAFEAAVKAWIPRALAFPEHLGVHMLRPTGDGREYGAVVKFRSQGGWEAFQNSPEYLHFLGEIQPYLEAAPRVETVSGLESWFTPFGSRVTKVPPRWKMAVVTWVGVCLMVYTVTLVLTPVIATWPWILGFMAINAGVVAGLTWLVMPLLSRVFRWWLFPRERASVEP